MRQLLQILALGAALSGAVNVSELTRPMPVDRSAINSGETATPTVEATAESTPLPDCPPGESYSPEMDRCWPDEPPPIDAPTETPPWGDDVQATMDADPYDNDYQYAGWCFEYVDGGTRIIYFECDATAESGAPPD